MDLDQRVEVLEKVIGNIIDNAFSIANGQVFINDATIEETEVNAAKIKTAPHVNSITAYDEYGNSRLKISKLL